MGDCEYVNYDDDVGYYVDYDNHHYHEDGNALAPTLMMLIMIIIMMRMALALMLRTLTKVSCQWGTGHEALASNCGHLRSR